MTERNRNQLQQTATASGAALLPALHSVPIGSVSPDLRRFLEAVKERLEVREGSRGNPFEAVVTKRDLASAGLLPAVMGGRALGGMSASGGLMMRRPDGSYATLSVDEFAAQIYQSPLFQSLKRGLSDPARFDDLPSEIKNYLLNSIADEAARRDADIRNTEFKLQTELRSLAYKVEEVTASVAQAAAGVRETTYAVAEAGRATAGKITQVEARLDLDVPDTDKLPLPPSAPYATLAALQAAVPVGDPTKYYRVTNPSPDADPATNDAELLFLWNGTQYLNAGVGVAKLEQRMTAVSDRVTGTESQHTIKVNAGGAAAGIGLAATSSLAGETTSAFIVQADKIAFVSDTDVIGTDAGQIDPYNPPTNRVPFGVDTVNDVVYINGQLRVGSPTGPTMDSITTAAGIYLSYSSQFFKYDTAGTPVDTSVTLTANMTGSLTGTLEWAALSGYSGTMPADVTVTADGVAGTATINVANMTADTAAFSITLTDGAAVYTDFVTLAKLRDGADSYTARITNDSAGVATTSAGAPVTGGFANATTVMEVYRGATKLTSGVTYSVLSNPQGLTTSINSSSGAFSVTAAGSWPNTTNTAKVTLQAVVTGGPTLAKDFTLTKNRQAIYTDYVFYRTTGTPPAPPTGWSDTPPTGAGGLYMSQATRNVVDDSLVGTWSAAVKLDGAPGADGSYPKYQWAVNTSTTTAPTTGWSDTALTPTAGQFLWMRQGTVVPPATAPASWGAGYRVSGEKGEPGTAGQNTAPVFAYRRSATALTTAQKPGGASDGNGGASSYTFSTKTLSLPAGTGWFVEPPSGSGPLYVTAATAQSATDSDTIAVAEWSSPVKLADNGAAGLNSAPLMIYARTATATAPSITGGSSTYTFGTGALTSPPTGTATWTQAAPTSGGPYLWVAHATAANTDPTDTIPYTEWSAARLVAKDGEDGVDGTDAVRIDLTNDSHGIPCNLDGTDPVFTGATTTASVYVGSSDDSANWTWVTTVSNVTITGANTRTITVTGISADTGYVEFTATRTGFSPQVIRFTVYRAKGGAYWILPSVDAVRKDKAGAYSPTTVTFTGKLAKADGTMKDYTGRFKIETSTNGTSWTTTVTRQVDEVSYAYTVPANISHIRASLYRAGGVTELLDQETLPVLSDGVDGAPGARGTVNGTGQQYGISSTAWSDAKANRVINNLLTGESLTTDLTTTSHLKIGDRVTLSGTTFTQERAWTGTAWLTLALIVDGNLLVNGSVIADKIAANQTFVGHTIQSTTYTAGSAGWHIKSDGTAEFNNVTVRGTVKGSVFTTADSGARMTINQESNKLIGYDANDVQRTIIEANIGYIFVAKNASAAAISATNTFATTDLGSAISGTSTNGPGVDGRSTNRVGVEGRSTNYIGGAFYGGSNAPPVYINPNASLPTSGALQGSLCVVSGKLYFHNGTTWKEVQLV